MSPSGRVRPSESILPRSSRARSGPSAPAWQRLDDCNWNAHLLQGFKLRLAIRRGRGVLPWITISAGNDARRWRPYARRHGPPSKSWSKGSNLASWTPAETETHL